VKDLSASFYLVTDEGFPQGVKCFKCKRKLPIGTPWSERLEAVMKDKSLVTVVCVYCAVEAA
jgi:hypothetical protein